MEPQPSLHIKGGFLFYFQKKSGQYTGEYLFGLPDDSLARTYSYRWHFTGTGTYQAGYSPTKAFTV